MDTSHVFVVVHSGTGIPISPDIADVFVLLDVNGHTRRTPVQSSTTTPVWRHCVKLPVTSYNTAFSSVLRLSLINEDKFGANVVIGNAAVPLTDYMTKKDICRQAKHTVSLVGMDGKPAGKLEIVIAVCPHTDQVPIIGKIDEEHSFQQVLSEQENTLKTYQDAVEQYKLAMEAAHEALSEAQESGEEERITDCQQALQVSEDELRLSILELGEISASLDPECDEARAAVLPDTPLMPLFCYFDPQTAAHVYTTDNTGWSGIGDKSNYVYHGIICYLTSDGVPLEIGEAKIEGRMMERQREGMVPLHIYHKLDQYVLSAAPAMDQEMPNSTPTVLGYVYPPPTSSLRPLVKLSRDDTPLYTADASMGKHVFTVQGTIGHMWSNGGDGLVPLMRYWDNTVQQWSYSVNIDEYGFEGDMALERTLGFVMEEPRIGCSCTSLYRSDDGLSTDTGKLLGYIVQ